VATAYRLGELADRLGGEVRGDTDAAIRGIATLDEAGPDQLSFWTHRRYRVAAENSRAAAILAGRECELAGHNMLLVDRPYAALALLLELYHPSAPPCPSVSPDARVDESAELGRDVQIGPFAVIAEGAALGDRAVVGAGSVIGAGCRVGEDSRLEPRVVLYAGTRVGRRCLIHSGVVLGADGYGFATVDGEHRKVPQVGRVVVEDDVEIGANTTIDRAMLGETRIGAGSKIDDLVMVAHGVRLGPGSLLVAQAGIAGSARLGRGTVLAGQSGVAGHLRIGDGVVVAAKSAVFNDLPDNAFVGGIPAIDQRRWKRTQALLKRLPEMRREIRELRARIDALEGVGDEED
jgi:UDP-3-O-[3-hydroxymyristoyl] glucosamine N-acyltransferase